MNSGQLQIAIFLNTLHVYIIEYESSPVQSRRFRVAPYRALFRDVVVGQLGQAVDLDELDELRERLVGVEPQVLEVARGEVLHLARLVEDGGEQTVAEGVVPLRTHLVVEELLPVGPLLEVLGPGHEGQGDLGEAEGGLVLLPGGVPGLDVLQEGGDDHLGRRELGQHRREVGADAEDLRRRLGRHVHLEDLTGHGQVGDLAEDLLYHAGLHEQRQGAAGAPLVDQGQGVAGVGVDALTSLVRTLAVVAEEGGEVGGGDQGGVSHNLGTPKCNTSEWGHHVPTQDTRNQNRNFPSWSPFGGRPEVRADARDLVGVGEAEGDLPKQILPLLAAHEPIEELADGGLSLVGDDDLTQTLRIHVHDPIGLGRIHARRVREERRQIVRLAEDDQLVDRHVKHGREHLLAIVSGIIDVRPEGRLELTDQLEGIVQHRRHTPAESAKWMYRSPLVPPRWPGSPMPVTRHHR
ncbi:MAG: hypothetical protein UW10_C0026G0008 [Candidatus Magasanikbacteria bacterium GW2011_GWA2_43_9]|nr:MAG: hypothetical protein UW10_C0026G0008 [Candidatus Magasanikbacteria bacterium GW2011_GWA2_43_9]